MRIDLLSVQNMPKDAFVVISLPYFWKRDLAKKKIVTTSNIICSSSLTTLGIYCEGDTDASSIKIFNSFKLIPSSSTSF
jgi:hypothetical protein